ncbi:hypothetical protein I548_2654 [Mycobacterium intracellulare]|nr:hypothetical protein I548_2654 [Mycobacterium intracellulare]
MSAYDDLLATVKSVRDRTGDPNAWQTGLAPTEVSAVITPTTRTDQLEAIAAKIRRQHADVFGAVPASGRRRVDPWREPRHRRTGNRVRRRTPSPAPKPLSHSRIPRVRNWTCKWCRPS